MTDEQDIQALIDGYLAAYSARNAAGCADFYEEVAVLLSPWQAPVHGRAAIAATHAEWFTEGETNKVLEIADLVVSGDLAVCVLHYAADVPGENGDWSRAEGTSLNSVRRQGDGAWKFLHTSLNMLDAATEETDA